MSEQELYNKFETKLANGELRMHSRWYFVLRTSLAIITIITVFLLAIFLASIITFAAHRNGWWVLPAFGWHGWFRFFSSLPWLLITFLVILIVLAEVLSRYFTALYRRPVLYTILGVVLIVVGTGVLIDRSHVHEYMASHGTPLMRPVYRSVDTYRPHNVFFGVLVSTTTDEWHIVTYRGLPETIIINDRTVFPDSQAIELNDRVVIFGDFDFDTDDATITARGIRKLPDRSVPDFIRIEWQPPEKRPLMR